jgi:hypothetical protein
MIFSRRLTSAVHWQAPTVIILAFVAGLAFALGHHAFYLNLEGQSVDDHLFDQQTNLAAGHTFAFLVRACLCVAIGVAYWQVFWGMLLRGTFAISHVEALAGSLGSILDMLNFGAMMNRPALLTLALLSWLIPLASILPPATLSVQITPTTEFAYPHIPVPHFVQTMASIFSEREDFTYPDRSDGVPYSHPSDATIRETSYLSPSRHLSRLVTSTAFRGALPLQQTVQPNSTYNLTLVGPAMQCQSTAIDILQQFNKATNCTFAARKSPELRLKECENLITYISWVPNATSLVPFDENSMLHGYLPLEPTGVNPGLHGSRYVGGHQYGPASIFIASRTGGKFYDIDNWTLLNCSLYNASYTATVKSDGDSRGVLSVTEVRRLNSVPYETTTSKRYPEGNYVNVSPNDNDSAALGYTALMECIGRLLVGTIFSASAPVENNMWVAGGVTLILSNDSYYNERDLTTQNEGLSQTLLPFAAELLPFQGRMDGNNINDPQWTFIANFSDPPNTNNYTVSYPTEAFQATTFNRSLARVIEELFQNMTLSLFSDPGFLEPAAENITVQYERMQNTYTYNSRNLLMSYGLALGFALIAVIAGCASIWYNGASYSNRFSTILRATRGQKLEELVALNDRTGADPLPKYLAKTRIRLGYEELSQRSDGDSRIQLRQKSDMVGEQSAMMEWEQRGDCLHTDYRPRSAMVSERGISMRSREDEDGISEISRHGM